MVAVMADFKVDLKTGFENLPGEVRSSFLNGLSPQLKFRQGLYSYKSYWQGALPWLRERLDNPPSEKIRIALEEMVSPAICGACDGRRLRADSLAVRIGGGGSSGYNSDY